jgi:hypothetical protein
LSAAGLVPFAIGFAMFAVTSTEPLTIGQPFVARLWCGGNPLQAASRTASA